MRVAQHDHRAGFNLAWIRVERLKLAHHGWVAFGKSVPSSASRVMLLGTTKKPGSCAATLLYAAGAGLFEGANPDCCGATGRLFAVDGGVAAARLAAFGGVLLLL